MYQRMPVRRRPAAATSRNDASRQPASHQPVVFAKLEVGAVDSPFEREADAIAGQVMRRIDTSSGADTMTQMGDAFGADFSQVRLHTDTTAARMSESIQARAFTHGSDIYFGAGEFRPETSGGRELLAHELTHTLQQGATTQTDTRTSTDAGGETARRSPLPQVSRDSGGSVRRWALDKGLDLSTITSVRTVGTAQQTIIAKDASGKELVIKPGSVNINLLQLADIVHSSVHDSDYVKSYGLDESQKAILAGKISDPSISVGSSWAASGGATPGALQPGEDDAAKARRVFSAAIVDSKTSLTAMQAVDGKNGKQLSKAKGTGANKGGSAMRDRLQSPMFMKSVGHASVTDAFTGNGDRVLGLNIGNFLSTGRDNFTLIDNMDMWTAQPSFKAGNSDRWISDDLKQFGANPEQQAAEVVNSLLRAMGNEGEDRADLKAWVDEPGANRKMFMVEDVLRGVTEAANRIVKTYLTDKQKKSGRELKKAVKGIEADDNQVDYWEILKARAMVLKDPSKAQKMIDRLEKRDAAARKKKSRK